MVSESNDRRGANGFISNEMINMIDTSEKTDEAQTKKDKTSISDELCLFGESSSVHGLKYVSERSSHCLRRYVSF